ncbi:MAG: hypothetical protein ACP5NX_02790 [Candidatus Bilamarchaeaceae archaeon]
MAESAQKKKEDVNKVVAEIDEALRMALSGKAKNRDLNSYVGAMTATRGTIARDLVPEKIPKEATESAKELASLLRKGPDALDKWTEVA